MMVLQKSPARPVHLSSAFAEAETVAAPNVSTPATAPVTTAPAAKPVPVMVMVVATPSRMGFGVPTLGAVIDGAAAMLKNAADMSEPPFVFVTVTVSVPTVAVDGMVIVPKIAFGVTWVTVAVPCDSVTVALAR